MTALLRKELTSIICSGTGLIFSLVFLLSCGLILWLFPGNYNILDNGYAITDSFYKLALLLLLVLIPSLTMKLISEEKKTGTFDLLRSRPVSIFKILFTKWLAVILLIILILISTLVYIYTLYTLGNPIGNLDLHIVASTYFTLLYIASLFAVSGILASAVTSNQIIAFLIALALNSILLYGIDLIGNIFSDPQLKSDAVNFSLSFHTDRIRKGIIYLNDITLFTGYFSLLLIIAVASLIKIKPRYYTIALGISIIAFVTTQISTSLRFDISKDHRYTISNESEQLMKTIKENKTSIKIDIYFAGNLNYGLTRLQNSVIDILNELNTKADNHLLVSTIDPYSLGIKREHLPEYMAEKSMPAIQLNEVDRNGKVSQQLIYPYAQIIHNGDTLSIPLLKNIQGNTAEENLNSSAENIEFEFVDAIHLLMNKSEQNIAFLEGHGELPRSYIYDAEEALAKYYNINRGQITDDISVLDNFKVVIIAGPTEKYTEKEKYILDQYLMKGGRILWIIDGAYVSYKQLTEKGESPSMKNETNIDDMLFNYGIRINSDFVQDAMCTTIPAPSADGLSYINIPWYYSPVLLPSRDNVITKDIAEVKASFVSSINLVNKKEAVTPQILLTTANRSHIVRVPEMINLETDNIQKDNRYFETSYVPIAISLEGSFTSSFENRIVPDSINLQSQERISRSKHTKMIAVSSSDIIRNDIDNQTGSPQILPMGYDRVSGKTFGNRDFIVNAVKWLADDNKWMQIRSKSRQMNLLDKQRIAENRDQYVLLNISVPILFVLLVFCSFYLYRKKKYT